MKNIIKLAIIGCALESLARFCFTLNYLSIVKGWRIDYLIEPISSIMQFVHIIIPITLLVFFITLLKRQK